MSEQEQSDAISIGLVTAKWAEAQKIKTSYTKIIESTNDHAKKVAFEEESFEYELLLYVTDEQTKGRGRFDRKWTAPKPGTSLMSTWSFLMDQTPSPYITSQIGLALYQAAQSTWGFLPWSLKAPNDLFIGTKKAAGVLVETVSQGDDHRLLVGIGFNILSHPAEIDTATSLVKNLTKETPLLGEDWISFLDRFLLELTMVISTSNEPLSSTAQANLLTALNKNPNLEKKYSNFKEVEKELLNI